jgi:hypothetical protein
VIQSEGIIWSFLQLKCINYFRLWSGLYHHVALYVDTKFSEELSAFIFRAKVSSKSVSWSCDWLPQLACVVLICVIFYFL